MGKHEAPRRAKYCDKCGARNKPEAKRCHECNHNIDFDSGNS